MDATNTPTQRLASLLLGQPVQEWITGRRDAGRSWREIAADLTEATGSQVNVTHEAVRMWASEVAA